VVLPKHRIDIFTDRDKFQREIKREFPLDQTAIRSFYESMDHFEATLDSEQLQDLILPKGIKKRWKFYQFVKRNGLDQRISEYTSHLGSNQEVRAFLESQLKFLSQTHSENPFTYQITKTLSNDNCCLFEIKGGIGHLKKLFLNKIGQFNGEVKNEVRVEAFNFENRHLRSISLGGFEGVLNCRYLLWNDEIRGLKEFLPKNFRTQRMIKKVESFTPRYYHFSIQYRLDPHIIPVGMRENLLLIEDPEQDLKGENFLHLNLFQPAEEDIDHKAFLTVSYLLEEGKIHEPSSFFSEIHQRITEKLQKLIPFSEKRFQLSFPLPKGEVEEEETLFPMEKSDFEIFRENAIANPVYHIAPQSFGDLFPISNRTPYKNLYITSPEILAALGFEGKFLLGLKTIALIWEQVEASRKKAIKQRKIA